MREVGEGEWHLGHDDFVIPSEVEGTRGLAGGDPRRTGFRYSRERWLVAQAVQELRGLFATEEQKGGCNFTSGRLIDKLRVRSVMEFSE